VIESERRAHLAANIQAGRCYSALPDWATYRQLGDFPKTKNRALRAHIEQELLLLFNVRPGMFIQALSMVFDSELKTISVSGQNLNKHVNNCRETLKLKRFLRYVTV